ncbi:MAG TPA: NADPH-dependent FMN reductase [Roseiflexaceae bacterium]|nr:NADPH-dependent FMN reductase [Roseiflexaceae bacterium]
MLDVITIAGSPNANSRSAAVLEYVRRSLEQRGLRTWGINVRDLPPDDLIYGRFDSPEVAQSAALLSSARAVIVATPVYKAAYSGVLKTFFDLLPQRALAGKLVMPVATGGSPAHMLALDYALRPLLGALGAQHVLQGVYILDSQIQNGSGAFEIDPTVAERLDGGLQYLVDELVGIEAIGHIR